MIGEPTDPKAGPSAPTDAASADTGVEPAPAEEGATPDAGPSRPGADPGSVGHSPDAGAAEVEVDGSDEAGPAVDADRLRAERDDYLERLQRLQADFENYRKRMTREQAEAADRGSEALAGELLPVLDGCDAAVQQGTEEVEPVRHQLTEILGKAGLEPLAEPGQLFDPEIHEAVIHEPSDGDADGGTTIVEVLRTGYAWKGRVLRPAMVKVRG